VYTAGTHTSPEMKKYWKKVLRWAMKCVKGMKSKEYAERLRLLGLTTLKRCRIRDDLTETYKILSSKENVKSSVVRTTELSPPSR